MLPESTLGSITIILSPTHNRGPPQPNLPFTSPSPTPQVALSPTKWAKLVGYTLILQSRLTIILEQCNVALNIQAPILSIK